MRRTILVILTILCAFMSNIFFISCQNKNDIFDHDDGFEIGYHVGPSRPIGYPSGRIACKSEKSVFDINSIEFELSYGFDLEVRDADIEYWNIALGNENSKNIIKTIYDWANDEYTYSITQEDSRSWLITFNYTEKIKIPKDLFCASEGRISIQAFAYDQKEIVPSTGKPKCYGMQLGFYYYIKDDYVWLGTMEYKYR